MSRSPGVACQCTACANPQWYDAGVCQGCHSDANIQFTWIAPPEKGARPSAAPSDTFQLDAGASDRLVDSWTNLVLVRGLTPRLTSAVGSGGIRSPGWYRLRGVNCSVRFDEPPADGSFADKLHRASDWINQTFILRLVVTFEDFAHGKPPKKSRLPNFAGMREFHHARSLRNKIAHGNPLTDQALVKEETALFRPGEAPAASCSLAIDTVLEPLWARLLVYAKRLEQGAAPLPANPGVVVGSSGATLIVQTFDGRKKLELSENDARLKSKIGKIVAM